MGELNKPLARADRTSHGFNAKTPVTAPKNRFTVNIPTFDNLSSSIADGTGRASHAAATMAPALCMLFLFLSLLVFPHNQAPIDTRRILILFNLDMTTQGWPGVTF